LWFYTFVNYPCITPGPSASVADLDDSADADYSSDIDSVDDSAAAPEPIGYAVTTTTETVVEPLESVSEERIQELRNSQGNMIIIIINLHGYADHTE
jgi:hypothetical protein